MQRGITRQPFGDIDGQSVERIVLSNGSGMEVAVLTYGGIIQSLHVPDRQGATANVALGFDNLADYIEKSPYFGAVVGRYANRIANGEFTLNGEAYALARNNGPNCLHGGNIGFDRHIWTAESHDGEDAVGVTLRRTSPDGEEGFPGTVEVSVTYTLPDHGNVLQVSYHATTDAPTYVNLSNHSYFNLAGEGNGDILRHVVQLRASRYTPVNATLIPTGHLETVQGTPFDFTEAHIIGERIDSPNNDQLAIAGGYDHNFVLDTADELGFAPNWNARVIDPGSGRVMDVVTDQPGVQFYSGNFLDGSFAGTSGRIYGQRAGFCLETQHFPDSPNQPNFPSTLLEPGDVFESTTTFTFGVL